MVGNRIEDYTLGPILGKGGFAKVYQAKCNITGLEVAIKKIDREKMTKENMTNRVREEVEIHSQLQHPSILQLFTWFMDDRFIYLVLELCHNRELRSYVKDKVFSELEVRNIMIQVIEGIKYLHGKQIVHRDISLSNLLVTKDMQVKIADFGLATRLNRPDEKHHTLCGTPNFISPEVASRASHGLEADVWSLGCLLYNLLVGKPPFESPSPYDDNDIMGLQSFDTQGVQAILKRIVKNDYCLPDCMSQEAQDLIHCLLQKDPKKRIKLDGILNHPFFRRGQIMSSHLTQDSGIHTMSTQRNSGFSTSPMYTTAIRSSSDCLPSSTNYNFTGRMTQSLDHLNHLCKKTDQLSVFSNCSCHQLANHYGQQNCHHKSADPGGGLRQDNHSLRPLTSNSRCSEYTNFSSTNKSSKNPKPQRLLQLCSQRLLPKRHRTKDSILNILEDGEVTVEFLKQDGRICRVLRISSDGSRIIFYEPNNGRGIEASGSVPPLPQQGAYQTYTIENLPEKHWRKYMHAYDFVSLIKEKTPKVTCYTDKLKCVLMENLTDFEVTFYEGGSVVKSSTKGVHFVDSTGNQTNVRKVDDCRNLSGNLHFMWNQAQEALEHCLNLENVLAKIANGPNFPVIIGRRPTSWSNGKENHTQSIMPSFTCTINKTGNTSLGTKSKEKKVNVPNIGSATRFHNGKIKVDFLDGSQLLMDGKRFEFHDSNGNVVHFTDSNIPCIAQNKMAFVPKILEHMKYYTVPARKVASLR